jgi:hypothetical protein
VVEREGPAASRAKRVRLHEGKGREGRRERTSTSGRFRLEAKEHADDATDFCVDRRPVLASRELGRCGAEKTAVLVGVRAGRILYGKRRDAVRFADNRKWGDQKTNGRDRERRATSS